MTDPYAKYPIGTTVYYSIEDYDTGEDIIYSGKVTGVTEHTLNLLDKDIKVQFYQLDTGIGVQYNNLYTIQELFQLKNRLEERMNELNKDILLAEVKANE